MNYFLCDSILGWLCDSILGWLSDSILGWFWLLGLLENESGLLFDDLPSLIASTIFLISSCIDSFPAFLFAIWLM